MPTPVFFPIKDLTVTAGQMRVPFTIDAHRSPHQQYFANRSFIAKQVGNVRDVGVTLGYKFGTGIPVTLEGGLYNGSGLTNQKRMAQRSKLFRQSTIPFRQKAESGFKHTEHPATRGKDKLV